jgi:hypothetical protein
MQVDVNIWKGVSQGKLLENRNVLVDMYVTADAARVIQLIPRNIREEGGTDGH